MRDHRLLRAAVGRALRTGIWVIAGWAIWAAVVLGWPQVPLNDSDTGRGWQSSTDVTLATIVATVMVLLLTAGLVAVQMLSPVTWRATRMIVDRWIYLFLLVALVLGVVLPLVVAADPAAARTRVAFVGFGWALILVMGLGRTVVGRATPRWLVDRVVTRQIAEAVKAVHRRPKSAVGLVSGDEVLIELLGADGLLDIDRRRAGIAVAVLGAARVRADVHIEQVVGLVLRVASISERRTTTVQLIDLVGVLGGLGVDQAHDPAVYHAVAETLDGVAGRARTAGHRDVAECALDTLVDVTEARLAQLLPVRTIPALQPLTARRSGWFVADDHGDTGITGDTARAGSDGRSPAPVGADQDSSADNLTAIVSEHEKSTPRQGAAFPSSVTSQGDHRDDLLRAVEDLAASADLTAHRVADVLTQLDLPSGRLPATSRDPAPPRWASDSAFDLLHDTVANLTARLPAPHPASTGWPDGWQGTTAFEQAVRRIGYLATTSYEHLRYPPSDVVEETLEHIAQRVRNDSPALPEPPVDRTGWRVDTLRETPSPARTVARTMGPLMAASFNAGFDRRSLLTGRRLLAAITGAAEDGDVAAMTTYRTALYDAVRAIAHQHREADRDAHKHRDQIVLAGLIAELDPLLAAGLQDARMFEEVKEVAADLAWSASGPPWPLVAQTWHAWLAAAEWPTRRQSPNALGTIESPVNDTLPAALAAFAEQELSQELFHGPVLAATLLVTLWANAVIAFRSGDRAPGDRLRGIVAAGIAADEENQGQRLALPDFEEHQDRPPGIAVFDPQIRSLYEATVSWADAIDAAAPGAAQVPRSAGHMNLRIRSRVMLAEPDFAERRYHGLRLNDDDTVVIIEEVDGTRRLLRDAEARARAVFAWGYGGTGPHNLADALVADALADLTRCPDCFGAAPCAAKVITCSGCRNTGNRFPPKLLASSIVSRVITALPDLSGAEPTLDGAEWTLTRTRLLAEAAARRGRRFRHRPSRADHGSGERAQ